MATNQKKIIKRFRDPKQDDQLKPNEYRTYASEHYLIFAIVFIFLTVGLFYLWGKFFDLPFLKLANKVLFLKVGDNIKTLSNLFYGTIIGSGAVAGYVSYVFVKPICLIEFSPKTDFFYYEDPIEATKEFNKEQLEKINSLKMKSGNKNFMLVNANEERKDNPIYKQVFIHQEFAIRAWLGIGLAGSGKSVFLKRVYNSILSNKDKLIVHCPDIGSRNDFIKSGYRCYVMAPYLKNSSTINLADILNVDEQKTMDPLIDLVVTSFFGTVTDNDDFFKKGAYAIFVASLKKICLEKRGNWTLSDWVYLLENTNTMEKFKSLLITYNSASANLIDTKAEKMVAGLLASMSECLTDITTLAGYYKYNTGKTVDLKKWVLDQDTTQVIILCSDAQYSTVSKINIALIVNLASTFLVSGEREIYFQKNNKRVFQVLDEYPAFGRNINNDKWAENIIAQGRKYGNSAVIMTQNTHQLLGLFSKNKEQGESFLGQFHNKVIAEPSDQDDGFVKNLIGKITYTEYQTTSTTAEDGKKSTGRSAKETVIEVGYKTLQQDLGFVKDYKGNNIGIKVCFAMVGFKVRPIFFIPFLDSFDKRKQIENNIQIKDGKEYFVKDGKRYRLYFSDELVKSSKEDQELEHIRKLIAGKTFEVGALKENLDTQDKRFELIGLETEIEDLKEKAEVLKLTIDPNYKKPEQKKDLGNEVKEPIVSDIFSGMIDQVSQVEDSQEQTSNVSFDDLDSLMNTPKKEKKKNREVEVDE